MQTAQILGARLSVAPRQDRRPREQALGRLEGMGNVAAGAAVADVDWSDPDFPIGGGESARQVFDRMADVLGPIAGMDAIVVSHGDAIRYALGWLTGHHAVDCPWLEVGPGAVFAVDAERACPPARLTQRGRARRR